MSSSVSQSKRLPIYTGVIGLAMTFFRIMLAILCIPVILVANANGIVAMVVAMIILFDYYDGKLFRKSSLNTIEKWRSVRRVLDSCGDRFCIQAVCIPLLWSQPHFLYPYVVICIKEVLTSTVCFRSFLRGVIIYPSNISRLSTAFVGVTVIVHLLSDVRITFVCTTILLCSGVLSFGQYIKKVEQYNRGELLEGTDYEFV